MDLATLGVAALVISLPVVIWDLATSRGSAQGNLNMLPYIQTAYLVFFIASFGLLLKVTNFSVVMLLATVFTGLIWLWDALAGKRARAAAAALTPEIAAKRPAPNLAPAQEPAWLELAKSFFPVILIVFVVRSFLVEPFRIPSGSMTPTLLVGDFILVNKFTYGIRIPVINSKIISVHEPKRGDVMVFRYPEDPSTDFIKRVVGVPGDEVAYINKRLIINGQAIESRPEGAYEGSDSSLSYTRYEKFEEKLGDKPHSMIVVPEATPVTISSVSQFPHRENCHYNEQGFTCKVPSGSYFMLGDNRDKSKDSRYWGFVPEDHIVGRAFMIWLHFGEFGRIGRWIE